MAFFNFRWPGSKPAAEQTRTGVIGILATPGTVRRAYLDDLDVYVEKLDPDNPDAYLTPAGDYRPFRREATVITVKDATPVTLQLRWTDRGPVLPGDVFGLGYVTPPGHVASIAWTVLDPHDTSMSAAV